MTEFNNYKLCEFRDDTFDSGTSSLLRQETASQRIM